MREAFSFLLLFSLFTPCLFAQSDPCEQTCDTLTGLSHWRYWFSSWSVVDDHSIRCFGTMPDFTICGGYSGTIDQVAHYNNTSLGTPDAVDYQGTIYLVFGYHNWSEDRDKIVIRESSDGRNFGALRTIIDNLDFYEFWNPELLIRSDGTWLLYVTGRFNGTEDPRVFLAVSTNGGQSFQFVKQSGNYVPVLGDHRFGSVISNPGGGFVFYATSNSDNQVYRFTSNDGVSWTKQGSISTWGLDVSTVVFDTTEQLFIVTYDPPTFISNDCYQPQAKFPLISVSSNGTSFSTVSVENYYYGAWVVSAEAAPLADDQGFIQATTPLLVYMNDQEAATYNQGGQTNNLFVADWKKSNGTYCP